MNTSLQWLDILYMRWVIWHVNNVTQRWNSTSTENNSSLGMIIYLCVFFIWKFNVTFSTSHVFMLTIPNAHSACHLKPAANKCYCETCPKCANSIITNSIQLFIQYATILRPQKGVLGINPVYISLELLLPSLVYVPVFPSSHLATLFMWMLYKHEKLHSSKCFWLDGNEAVGREWDAWSIISMICGISLHVLYMVLLHTTQCLFHGKD
jgi:hypothetical protein